MGTFNYNIFLNEVLSQIKQEFEANNKETEYILWFSNIKYVESEELKIIVSIPSNMVKDKLITSGYLNLIESKLLEISGYKIKVDLTVKNITNNSPKKENVINELPLKPKVEVKKHPQLNERYTFENFVKGDNNSFAYNASIAVSKNPGKAYNPMLIYGGVGLGKTNLMESIGNAIYKEKPLAPTKTRSRKHLSKTY